MSTPARRLRALEAVYHPPAAACGWHPVRFILGGGETMGPALRLATALQTTGRAHHRGVTLAQLRSMTRPAPCGHQHQMQHTVLIPHHVS